MDKDKIALAIYNTISRQYFADWYGVAIDEHTTTTDGDFDKHIRGELNCKSKSEILAQIKDMFLRNSD